MVDVKLPRKRILCCVVWVVVFFWVFLFCFALLHLTFHFYLR